MQEIQAPSRFRFKTNGPGKKNWLLSRNLSLTFGVERRVWMASVAYIVFLCLFEAFYLRAGFGPLVEWLSANRDPIAIVITMVYAAGAIYLSFLFVLAALSSRWPYKLLYFAVLSFGVLVEYGYSRAIGRFTNGFDVDVALTATSDQQSYAAVAFLEPSSCVPIFVLAGMLWLAGKKLTAPAGAGVFAALMIATAVFSIHLAFVNPILFDRRFTGTSLGSMFLTSAEHFVYDPLSTPVSRAIVETPSGVAPPTNNIVVVFDESVRGDHLSLNGYERQTTPFLDELAQKKLLSNFGIAVSGATSSALSYRAFITGATIDDVANNGSGTTNGLPTIFQYAKAMGYKTYYIDGQRTDYWGGRADDTKVIDQMISSRQLAGPDWEHEKYIDRGAIDRVGSEQTIEPWELDFKIAETVRDIYSGSTGNFILIYKRGTHIPYQNAYPERETMWKPAYNWDDYYEIPGPEKLTAVVNSYDNSIRYNVDGFFKSLATDYSNLPNNTVIAYTSDHGESLYAQGASGHGGRSREEATVPMLLIGLKDRTVDTSFKASHANLFTTLLDLIDYPAQMRKHSYSISLFKARASDSKKRFFNPDAQGKVAFD
ncbi:MAG TPA: sulfatase-like hydrolase/transferase [Pyrinomonadaceae bacterium]|nr:sulfatase-like hydrolase/transferase [Pyrinomonadaceae bacterium]